MKKRIEINENYKWDLTNYFESDLVWEGEYNLLNEKIDEISKFKNTLNQKDTILNCLLFDHDISLRIEQLYVYAHLKVCEDFGNSKYVQMLEKVRSLDNKYGVLASFILPELSKLESKFLLEMKEDVNFTDFSCIIEDIIRNKPHTLSQQEEKLMANSHSFSGGFSSVFHAFDTEIKFEDAINLNGEKKPLTQALYGEYMMSNDSNLRKTAFLNMHKKFGEFNNMLSMNYINSIKARLFYAQSRNFETSLDSSIFYEHSSKKVYNALIKAVNNKLPIFHKYYKIKAQALNVSKLHICDRLAPIVSETRQKYTYDEALDLIVKAVEPLGKDYQNLILKSKNERWIDVFENDGKETGAFSSGAYGKNPVVLTNFTGNLNSVFTLAHELGHAMHTYFSNKTQCFEKANYSIFVAEIASTVNEMLLLRYLLNLATSKEEKLYLLDYFCSMMCSTVHRQTMFAEFEEFAHKTYQETGALSQDILNDKYLQLNKTYFGSNVEVLDEVKYEWSRIPHFYNSFYVYKYATGLITAILISNNLFYGINNQKEKYFEFLKAGGSLAPIETVKLAGIDLENSQTMEDAFKFFEDIITELKNLTN